MVHDDDEIEPAITAVAHEAGGGLIVMPDTFNMVHRRTTIGLAARHRLSAIYPLPYFAREGGLTAYGPDEIDMFASFRICRSSAQRCQSQRPAGPAAYRLPPGDQSQDRQGAWPYCAAATARTRGRGHRIEMLSVAVH